MRLRFGEFCFDSSRRELTRNGAAIHLTPKAFRLLQLLVEQRPNIIGKEQLYSVLWPATYVDEANLSNLISEIRAALGDHRLRPRFIRTVHGFGYGFIGEALEQQAPSRAAHATFRLLCGSREFDLHEGETMVGRDDDVALRIDAPGVSRHHARVVVNGDQVFVEDLGSKNGTFVGGKRVRGRVEVHDGDEVRVGSELMVVRAPRRTPSTLTQKPSLER